VDNNKHTAAQTLMSEKGQAFLNTQFSNVDIYKTAIQVLKIKTIAAGIYCSNNY
jgi:hypothetical protein